MKRIYIFYMKKNALLILLVGIVSLFCITSCAPDYETDFEVMTLFVPDNDLAPVLFPVGGGEDKAVVETNVALANWKATSNASWLTIDKKEGEIIFKAGPNNSFDKRYAIITVEYGYQSYTIPVSQLGNESILMIEDGEDLVVRMPAAEDAFSVKVHTNMTLDNVLITDTANFVSVVNIEDVEGSATEKLVTFKLNENIGRNIRYSTITFVSSDNYNHTASFVVVQQERVYIEIPLREDMLSSNAQEPNEGPIGNLLDNNPGSFFHSAWSYSISDPHYFQVDLDEPINGCLFWYQNRNNGNGKPTNVSIMVSADGENWTEMARITSGLPTGSGSTYESLYLESQEPFKHFRFVVNATNDGAAPTFFNMAEFKMYKI